MKFVDSSFEIIEQAPGLEGAYKHCEKIARVSYKSENSITETSAKKFVDNLIKNQHLACLEHITIYLFDRYDVLTVGEWTNSLASKYANNPYSKVKYDEGVVFRGVYITTNARVIIENDWYDDLNHICEPTWFHEKRYSVKFVLPIGIVRDVLRHRKFSYINESTRYINYTKEKHGSGLTIVIPRWIYSCRDEIAQYVDPQTYDSRDYLLELSGEELVKQLSCEDRHVSAWVDSLRKAESDYFYLMHVDDGYKLRPEQARGVLPLDTRSELVMTGFASDWVHFFNMRSYIKMAGSAHEDLRYVVDQLLEEFIKRGYINEQDLYKEDKIDS